MYARFMLLYGAHPQSSRPLGVTITDITVIITMLIHRTPVNHRRLRLPSAVRISTALATLAPRRQGCARLTRRGTARGRQLG
jgi:hypothetical protein